MVLHLPRAFTKEKCHRIRQHAAAWSCHRLQAAQTALAEQTRQLQELQRAHRNLQDALATAEAAAAADRAQLAAAAASQEQHAAQAAVLSEARSKAARLSGEVERLIALGNEDRAALNAAERTLAAQAQVGS